MQSQPQNRTYPVIRLDRLIKHLAFIVGLCVPSTAALCQSSATSQNSSNAPSPSDPQALTFASQAISALLGKQSVHDLTLTGTFTWETGSTDQGTVTLKALGSGESRMDLVFADGTRTEIRDASTGTPQGKWISQEGKTSSFSGHNLMTDPVWFFPALGSLAAGPNVVLSYVGLETRDGQSVQHLRSYLSPFSALDGTTLALQQLSTMDFYLDATSSLPVAVVFNQHPDNDVGVNIPIEVDYSDYQSVSGVTVPMHIHKTMNGAPLLDITLSNAEVNSGLTLTQFSVN